MAQVVTQATGYGNFYGDSYGGAYAWSLCIQAHYDSASPLLKARLLSAYDSSSELVAVIQASNPTVGIVIYLLDLDADVSGIPFEIGGQLVTFNYEFARSYVYDKPTPYHKCLFY